MKIFITGLAGMLGSNIAYELHNMYDVSGVDVIKVDMPRIISYQFDMLDINKLKECLYEIKPDVIIHTAAAVNVDQCEVDPTHAYELNVTLTQYICEIADEIKAKVIYISTDAVFDGESSELYCEEDLVNPINVYGTTKLQGETIVSQYVNNLVLRTNIYGFNIQSKNSFGEWIYKSLMDDRELNMFEDIDFSPILVNDLASVISLLIRQDRKGLFHVCGTGCITKYEFGCKLKEVFQIASGSIRKSLSSSFDFKAKRSKHMGMNNGLVSDILNIRLPDPEESIEKFYALYCSGYSEKLKKFGGIDNGDKDR